MDSRPFDTIESAIVEVDRAAKRVAHGTSKQITRTDDRTYLKSVAYSWFQSHRPILLPRVGEAPLSPVDAQFQVVLDATNAAAARVTYKGAFKKAKASLVALRGSVLTASGTQSTVDDAAPDFSPLASDEAMRAILLRRWEECQKCLRAEAHLAAVVMIGGLLETLLVARANRLVDKRPLLSAKSAPKDDKKGKTLPLSKWMLNNYLDVGHEVGWLSKPVKSVACVLRDYRNYVHPVNELSEGVVLNAHDSKLCWEITKNLAGQLLESARKASLPSGVP